MRVCAALLLTASLYGEGTVPKPAPAEYPVSARLGVATIAAEFMVHSISGHGQTFFTDDYLVVEAAVYPDKLKEILVANTQFQLRLNGKRTLLAQPPAFVAASLKYPDWDHRRRVEAQAGPVIIGRPPHVGRFPGDPTETRDRLPEPPRAPSQLPSSGDAPQAKDVALEMALPEGTHKHPVSGFVYFPHKGKLKGIKSIELLVKSGNEEVSLKLR